LTLGSISEDDAFPELLLEKEKWFQKKLERVKLIVSFAAGELGATKSYPLFIQCVLGHSYK
jgi:hypothetical protein